MFIFIFMSLFIFIVPLTSLTIMAVVVYRLSIIVQKTRTFQMVQQLRDRKRIAYVCLALTFINFIIIFETIFAHINNVLISQKMPVFVCYNVFFNVIFYVALPIQGLSVCFECLLYLVALTPYRKQLIRILKKIKRKIICKSVNNGVHVIQVK